LYGIIPVAKWLAEIKQRSDVSCRLCKRAREQRGASAGKLPEETYGHIISAFCDGMATSVTANHFSSDAKMRKSLRKPFNHGENNLSRVSSVPTTSHLMQRCVKARENHSTMAKIICRG